MDVKKGWLECKISEGMLSKEYTVELDTLDNKELSFFAYQGWISRDKRYIEVDIVSCNDDVCIVNLPYMPLENHGRTVKVHSNQIKEYNL